MRDDSLKICRKEQCNRRGPRHYGVYSGLNAKNRISFLTFASFGCLRVIMDLSIRERGEVTVVDVHGEIDLYNAPQIKTAVDRITERGKVWILINLSLCSYLDSTGIGILLHCHSDLRKRRGQLKLLSPSESIVKVFQLTRLENHFEIHMSEAEALASFSRGSGRP